SAPETLTLTSTLVKSDGTTRTQTQVVTVAPGQTLTQSFSTKVTRSDIGSYTLTFTAADGTESASAKASASVVRS
ncbi:MAG: hypothetical protein V7644_565, partial [Actinomycetota bacterium]